MKIINKNTASFYSGFCVEGNTVKMILLAIVCTSMVAASEILVKREQNYDTVVWDGDCSRINANYKSNEKTCICQKIITENKIRTELPGFFYPSADGFGICLYDYRETGLFAIFLIIFLWKSSLKHPSSLH